MIWLNVKVAMLHDEVCASATPHELGIWFRLLAYCASQENGGTIMNCIGWTDRQWWVAAGISKAELDQTKSRLWTWSGVQTGVLWVYGYPKDQEAIVKAKREGGKRGARKRWKPKNVVKIQDKSPRQL